MGRHHCSAWYRRWRWWVKASKKTERSAAPESRTYKYKQNTISKSSHIGNLIEANKSAKRFRLGGNPFD